MGFFLHLFDAAGNQIMGGSTDPNAQGGIELLKWTWSARGFNPNNLSDMSITKSFDIATVPLLAKANSAEVLSASLVTIDSTGLTAQRVDLDGVTVQQVEIGGVTPTPQPGAPPSEEEVILRYNVIRFYSPNVQNSVALSGAVAGPAA